MIQLQMQMGDVLGSYRGKPVYQWIVANGKRFDYDGIAIRDNNDNIEVAKLQDGDCIIAPGLVYREPSKLQDH